MQYKKVTVRAETLRKLKAFCAERDKYIYEVATEIIEQYVEERRWHQRVEKAFSQNSDTK